MEKLEEGWDEERGHPQALAVAKRDREMQETLATDLHGGGMTVCSGG